MSRNNKSAKRVAIAKKFSDDRKKGIKGATRTKAVHGKKNAWWQIAPYSYSAYISGGGKPRKSQEASE